MKLASTDTQVFLGDRLSKQEEESGMPYEKTKLPKLSRLKTS